jgi:hypothetical protein
VPPFICAGVQSRYTFRCLVSVEAESLAKRYYKKRDEQRLVFLLNFLSKLPVVDAAASYAELLQGCMQADNTIEGDLGCMLAFAIRSRSTEPHLAALQEAANDRVLGTRKAGDICCWRTAEWK